MGSEQDMYDCLIVAVMNKLNCFKVDYLLVFGRTEVADGDARGPVDEERREPGGQDGRLEFATVVVGHEVDDILVQGFGHGERRGRQATLGVAHGRGPVVGGAEVAVAVDEGQRRVKGWARRTRAA